MWYYDCIVVILAKKYRFFFSILKNMFDFLFAYSLDATHKGHTLIYTSYHVRILSLVTEF